MKINLNEKRNFIGNEKEPDLVFRIDSLLTIINTNMDKFPVDSLLNLPDLLVNTDPHYEIDTEYSINDYALEKMNEGFNHLNNHNYNDAIDLALPPLSVSIFKHQSKK